jgi:hypothetical protein
MTAPTTMHVKPLTVEDLYRRHIREMRRYALQLADILGAESPIVKRIQSCATSNEDALDRVTKRKCESCGQDKPA